MTRKNQLLLVVVALVAFLGVGAYLAFGRNAAPGIQTRSYDVTVNGITASRTALNAYQGDTIKLTFTTDKDEEIHLHGYDIHFECKAGTPLTKTFLADKPGTFEYEIEATSQHLGNLVVNPR